MNLDIFAETGVPLERQTFTWKETAGPPLDNLDDDAFTRVRVLLLSALEAGAIRLQHALANQSADLRGPLARIRRIEQLQAAVVNALQPPEQSPLDAAVARAQAAVEVTAALASREPDPYLAQVYRFGLLEHVDHLYRFSALMDRLEGRDANDVVKGATEIQRGRPTAEQHRDPLDDVRLAYSRAMATPGTKLHARLAVALAHDARVHDTAAGPSFANPLARMLFAELATVAEQHVTQYESLIDPSESALEKWMLHEAAEVYGYWSCATHESNPRIKALWERLLGHELGQLHHVMELYKQHEQRDPSEILTTTLPAPLMLGGQRQLVRDILGNEVDLRASASTFLPRTQEADGSPSVQYRRRLNADGSPSDTVATSYVFTPGTELFTRIELIDAQAGRLQ
jgi:hypothetical protein